MAATWLPGKVWELVRAAARRFLSLRFAGGGALPALTGSGGPLRLSLHVT